MVAVLPMDVSTLVFLALQLGIFLIAISIHEAAHAYAAYRLGDDTAVRLGRLTINPVKHIDPMMSIVVPVVLLLTLGFAFGGAKPVPVVPYNLREPRRDMMWIAWAGPASNVAQAILFSLLLVPILWLVKLGVLAGAAEWVVRLAMFGVLVNLILAGFNMIPVPPLDGSRIAKALLPERAAAFLDRIEPVGLIIILVLLATGIVDVFLTPIQSLAHLMLLVPTYLVP